MTPDLEGEPIRISHKPHGIYVKYDGLKLAASPHSSDQTLSKIVIAYRDSLY